MVKYCPECGNPIIEQNMPFCPRCGGKLPGASSDNEHPTTFPPTESESSFGPTLVPPEPDPRKTSSNNESQQPTFSKILTQNKPAIKWIIIGIFILLIIVIPTKTISESVKVPYLANETFYVTESYQAQEPYEVSEPYEKQEPYSELGFHLERQPTYNFIDAPYGSHFEVDLEDKTVHGCDCSKWGFLASHVPSVICVQEKCLTSSVIQTYGMTTNYRTVIDYHTVTRYRTVTKFREIPQYRDVIKTREETQPSEVNWILSFKTPYSFHLPFIS